MRYYENLPEGITFKNLVPVKAYDYGQEEEFWAELKRRANGQEILSHMWCRFINYYAGSYDSDSRIGQEATQDGYYLFEKR